MIHGATGISLRRPLAMAMDMAFMVVRTTMIMVDLCTIVTAIGIVMAITITGTTPAITTTGPRHDRGPMAGGEPELFS